MRQGGQSVGWQRQRVRCESEYHKKGACQSICRQDGMKTGWTTECLTRLEWIILNNPHFLLYYHAKCIWFWFKKIYIYLILKYLKKVPRFKYKYSSVPVFRKWSLNFVIRLKSFQIYSLVLQGLYLIWLAVVLINWQFDSVLLPDQTFCH